MSERPFRVLDVSAGNRAIWFDKQYPDAIYIDIRPEVKPDLVADSRMLPAEIGDGFALVVFDPPHKNNGPNFGMARSYGCFDHDHIRSTIANTAREAHRVTRDDALMAFKWNDHSIRLTKVVGLLSPYWEPLFGHGVSHQQRSSSTSWVMLRRRAVAETHPRDSSESTPPVILSDLHLTPPSADHDAGNLRGLAEPKHHQPHAVSQGWRDIETAPRDGTLILASSVNHHTMAVVGWSQHWEDEPHWNDVGGRNAQPSLYMNGNYFTHWMHLPAPPSPAKTGGVE